jgi:hypothetical protein
VPTEFELEAPNLRDRLETTIEFDSAAFVTPDPERWLRGLAPPIQLTFRRVRPAAMYVDDCLE